MGRGLLPRIIPLHPRHRYEVYNPRYMATLPQLAPLPTEDEKTVAMLNYILSIFAAFIAPLVIWLVKRDSRFVGFQALQMLLWHALYYGVAFLFMLVMFATMAMTSAIPHNSAAGTAFTGFVFFLAFF